MRPVLFDHIAIAVPRLADAEPILAGRSTFGATTDDYRYWHWRYEGGGDLEVLEPAGEDGSSIASSPSEVRGFTT